MIFWLLACKIEIETPSSACECALDFSAHPKNEALQAVVDDLVHDGLPGLSVAMRTPDGVWAGAGGFADLEHEIEMNVCHVHHMASVAKTWFATEALLLDERGELDLDAQLSSYLDASVLEDIANADRVTLREVMSHTSGIPDFNDSTSYVIGELNDPLRPNDPLGLLDVVRGWPAVGEPGEVYEYADTNYVLMSLVIDELAGDSLDAIQTDIIEPLKLDATTFYRRDVPEPDCICNTYWEIGNDRLENVSDLSKEYATQVVGADGLAASPLDALTFVEAIVRGDLITADSRTQMTEWSEPSIDDEGYGYGLGLARVIPGTGELHGHTGGGVGTGAVMRASPHQEVTFVAATNVGMFLGGPLSDVFDEDMWDAFAEAAGIEPAAP